MSKYKPGAYRNYLRFSKKKHILVEGKEDKIAITFLLNEMADNTNLRISNIAIESAEQIISPDGKKVGNRDKVLNIASSITEKDYKFRFLGFVDRELDGFEIESSVIEDKVRRHRIDGRVLFSRGHSVENYLFEISILGLILQGQSTIPFSNKVLRMFEEVFEDALHQSCALGLAASDLELLGKIKKSIKWNFFNIDSQSNLLFLVDDWISETKSQRKISDEISDLFKARFFFYLEKLRLSEEMLPRWLCHGHMGLDFLYAVYCACLVKVAIQSGYSEQSPTSHIDWVGRDKLFTLLAKLWAKKALEGNCEYPEEIAKILNISAEIR